MQGKHIKIKAKRQLHRQARGILSSKKELESAIRGGIGSKNEARGGCIGSRRQHKASKSTKYNQMQGKHSKIDAKRQLHRQSRGIISSKKELESAIRGDIGSRNEARCGCIGNLRQHKASKSAKYSKTNGK